MTPYDQNGKYYREPIYSKKNYGSTSSRKENKQLKIACTNFGLFILIIVIAIVIVLTK